ncbi:hypothetical protein KCP73_13175 [Salmonella enterica subsp. enterica]|nr:hypothetical protein KCP73_13175 [Salmonella enterica subsp. enterica]
MARLGGRHDDVAKSLSHARRALSGDNRRVMAPARCRPLLRVCGVNGRYPRRWARGALEIGEEARRRLGRSPCVRSATIAHEGAQIRLNRRWFSTILPEISAPYRLARRNALWPC